MGISRLWFCALLQEHTLCVTLAGAQCPLQYMSGAPAPPTIVELVHTFLLTILINFTLHLPYNH